MESIFLTHNDSDKIEYKKIIEQTTNAIAESFTDEKAYKTQNAQEIFTQHILTDSFQMNIIIAGTPQQIYGRNTAEIVIFIRS